MPPESGSRVRPASRVVEAAVAMVRMTMATMMTVAMPTLMTVEPRGPTTGGGDQS